MLKLQYPDEESRHEADALAHWDGDGAIRLLAHDPGRRPASGTLQPRTPPARPSAGPALDALVGLLPGSRPAGAPFTPLAEEAAGWSTGCPGLGTGRPAVRAAVLDAALDLLTGLASSQGEQVLVNQDLHAGNVLAADREPWLAIDPKPLTGERSSLSCRWCAAGVGPLAGRRPAPTGPAQRRAGARPEPGPGLDDRSHAGLERRRRHRLPGEIDVVRWLLDSN